MTKSKIGKIELYSTSANSIFETKNMDIVLDTNAGLVEYTCNCKCNCSCIADLDLKIDLPKKLDSTNKTIDKIINSLSSGKNVDSILNLTLY